jgi:pilus assembly protein CpaB
VSRFQRSTMPSRQPAQMAVVGGPVGAPAVPAGPVVRVTRGKSTTVEPVGRGTGALLDRTSQGTRSVGRTAPAAAATLMF